MRFALFTLLFAACYSRTPAPDSTTNANATTVCQGADFVVPSSAQCFDGGRCYQSADGGWCTSPRADNGFN